VAHSTTVARKAMPGLVGPGGAPLGQPCRDARLGRLGDEIGGPLAGGARIVDREQAELEEGVARGGGEEVRIASSRVEQRATYELLLLSGGIEEAFTKLKRGEALELLQCLAIGSTREIWHNAVLLLFKRVSFDAAFHRLTARGNTVYRRAAIKERSDAERRLVDAIRGARHAGLSWSAIGTFVGVTGEMARQRYASKVA
jgi:hypothetical protein